MSAQPLRSSPAPLGIRPGVRLDYLGPADVIGASPDRPDRVVVRSEDGDERAAGLALPFGYQPRVGDVLLVLTAGKQSWAIGTILATGPVRVESTSDVAIVAGGKLRLEGRESVDVAGRVVEIGAETLRTAARVAVERFDSLAQRVRGLLTVHAQDAQTLVDGDALQKSRNATVLTEETMTINGRQVHLG